jgi:multisubunit Na+/H+ antiporter MnhB subunit
MIELTQRDSVAVSKYSVYVSRLRNVFQGTSMGMALIGFSQSTLIEKIESKKYFLGIGVSIIIITFLYGLDNVTDYEQYVYKYGINDSVVILDGKSVYNDILLYKGMLVLLLIILLMIMFNILF